MEQRSRRVTARDEAIMLKNSPVMLCWNASNYVRLCSCCVPIMLMQKVDQLVKTAPQDTRTNKSSAADQPLECSAT